MTRPNRPQPARRVARMRRAAEVARDVLVGSAFGTIIVLARSWGSVAARVAARHDRPEPVVDHLQN